MSLDNNLRASIAAEMLWPREELRDPESFKRLREHILALRLRVETEVEEMHECMRGMDDWRRHQSDQEENRNEP